jgi:hypothetical protein
MLYPLSYGGGFLATLLEDPPGRCAPHYLRTPSAIVAVPRAVRSHLTTQAKDA